MSDAQVGAAAMSGSPNSMFPKIPIPPAEVSRPLQNVSLRNEVPVEMGLMSLSRDKGGHGYIGTR